MTASLNINQSKAFIFAEINNVGDLRLSADLAENASTDGLLFRWRLWRTDCSILLLLLIQRSTAQCSELFWRRFIVFLCKIHIIHRHLHILPVEAIESYLSAGLSVRDIAVLFGVGETV